MNPVHPQNNEAQAFGIRTLKIFGGIQIGSGAICGILSIAGVIIHVEEIENLCGRVTIGEHLLETPCYVYYIRFIFSICCIISSVWVCIY